MTITIRSELFSSCHEEVREEVLTSFHLSTSQLFQGFKSEASNALTLFSLVAGGAVARTVELTCFKSLSAFSALSTSRVVPHFASLVGIVTEGAAFAAAPMLSEGGSFSALGTGAAHGSLVIGLSRVVGRYTHSNFLVSCIAQDSVVLGVDFSFETIGFRESQNKGIAERLLHARGVAFQMHISSQICHQIPFVANHQALFGLQKENFKISSSTSRFSFTTTSLPFRRFATDQKLTLSESSFMEEAEGPHRRPLLAFSMGEGEGIEITPTPREEKKSGQVTKKGVKKAKVAEVMKEKKSLSQEFDSLFDTRVTTIRDLPRLFDFIEAVGDRWKKMSQELDRLREERIAQEEKSSLGEAFKVDIGTEGSFSTRGTYKDRRSELSDGLEVQAGFYFLEAALVLVHEMTHALPLDVLFPELSRLPYEERSSLGLESDMGQVLPFDETFRLLIQPQYQDEAISYLAETLFYRDFKRAGLDPKGKMSEAIIAEYEETLRIYEEEGLISYIRSERYIGRNHRSAYNKARALQLSVLASMNPAILADPSLGQVLHEHGLHVEGATPLLNSLDEIGSFLEKPTLKKGGALLSKLMMGGLQLQVDLESFMRQLKEAQTLLSGATQKAKVSFLGVRDQTIQRVELLAETRKHFDRYATEFEAAWKKAKGKPEKVEWEDTEGLLALYRQAVLLSTSGESVSRAASQNIVDQLSKVIVSRMAGSAKALLLLERGSILQDRELVMEGFKQLEKVFSLSLTISDGNTDAQKLEQKDKFKEQKNETLRFFVQILKDPFIRKFYRYFNLPWEKVHETIKRQTGDDNFKMFDVQDIEALAEFVKVIAPWESRKNITELLYCLRRKWDSYNGRVYIPLDPSSPWPSISLQISSRLETEGSSNVFSPKMEVEYKTEDDYERDVSRELRRVLNFQRRSIEANIKIKSRELDEVEDLLPSMPLLFWVDTHFPTPDSFLAPLLIQGPAGALKAIPIFFKGKIDQLYLQVRQIELNQESEKSHLQRKSLESELLIAVEDLTAGDPGIIWAMTDLAIRYAKSLHLQQEDHSVTQFLDEFSNKLSNGLQVIERSSQDISYQMKRYGSLFSSANLQRVEAYSQLAIATAKLFLPLYSPVLKTRAKKEILNSILDEYSKTISLKRQGFDPGLMSYYAREFSVDLDLRPQVTQIFELAITQTSALPVQSESFRQAVKTLIASIDDSHLIHEDKHRLMILMFEKIIPEKLTSTTVGSTASLTPSQRLQLFKWFKDSLVSEENLSRLGLYPSAEKVLLKRSQEVLKELRAAPLPLDVQREVLEVGFRLDRYMRRVHPEILEESNLERLEKVSDQDVYQFALADIYPSRRVMVDLNLPVAQWHPLSVRRGLPDPARAWRKVKKELERLLSSSSLSTQTSLSKDQAILDIFEAFVLREVETLSRPTDLLKEAKDLYAAYQERSVTLPASVQTGAQTAMSLYAKSLRLFSQKDKLLFDELLKLPTVAWSLKLIDRVLAEKREFNPLEMEVVKKTLAASTLSDSKRKQELYLALLNEERLPIEIKRLAAQGLAYSSGQEKLFENLTEGYRSKQDINGENSFYRLVTEYWRTIGEIPSGYQLLLLSEQVGKNEKLFWDQFHQAMRRKPEDTLSLIDLQLTTFSQGRHADRFLQEAETYLTADNPERLGLVYQKQFKTLFSQDATQRKEELSLVEEVKQSRSRRLETLELIQLDLPAVFIRLPQVVRFGLLSFLRHIDQSYTKDILDELRQKTEKSDAEVVYSFLLNVGLAKGAQTLAQLVGVIPDADRKVYAEAEDKVPASSTTEVRRTLQKELEKLGKTFEEVFLEWNDTPIASASIGEVYQAKLKDGTVVYIKIIPPSKGGQVEQAADALLKVGEDYERKGRHLESPFPLSEFLRNLNKQIKTQVNLNTERKQAMTIEDIQVPVYLFDLSTERMSVMLPVSGVKVTELQKPEDRKQAAKEYAQEALRMFWQDGLYHADPHPGNVFFDPRSQKLTWLDFGLIAQITRKERVELLPLLIASASGDIEAQVKSLQALAPETSESQLESLKRELEKIAFNAQDSSAKRLSTLLNIAGGKLKIKIPPRTLSQLSFLLTVYGVTKKIDSERNVEQDMGEAMIGFHSK